MIAKGGKKAIFNIKYEEIEQHNSRFLLIHHEQLVGGINSPNLFVQKIKLKINSFA